MRSSITSARASRQHDTDSHRHDNMSSDRFSIPPARHANAVSEAQRIDSVLRREIGFEEQGTLASEVALAERIEARIARGSRATVPAGRKAPRTGGSGTRQVVPESGVTERSVATPSDGADGGTTIVDELAPDTKRP